MNDSTDTTAPAPRKEPLVLTIDQGSLACMEPQDLRFLAGAVLSLLDVGSGLGCQPRFWKTDRRRNGAGDMLECVNDGLCGLLDAIYKQAEATTPASSDAAEHLAWCKLQIKAEWADGLNDFAVLSSECVRDVNTAEFAEKHPQGVSK